MKLEENILPSAEELRASMPPSPAGESGGADLKPYFPMFAKLAGEAAARGEKGIVIKFEVADYADEAACGKAITAMGEELERLGYICCVSYDTYALKLNEGRVTSSIMRNPAIIAMTVIW